MTATTLSRQVPLPLIFVILGGIIQSSPFFVESKDAQVNFADQLAVCLHRAFEENTGFDQLHKLYNSLSCLNRNDPGKHFLHNITEAAAVRLNAFKGFLHNLSKTVQQRPRFRGGNAINYTNCCQENSTDFSTEFSDRVRFSVDLKKGCSIRQYSQGPLDSEDSYELNTELLSSFQENFDKSPLVAWQYFGSINGEYLQYPANARYCEGTSSQFDPRFRSWYVETASPVKKNLVIIIDRSGSMGRTRMGLAKDAAITVLDTLSAQDNVGLIAFSSGIQTPEGCFGSTVATGIPANLDLLRQWVRTIYARGRTYYAPAFRHAFSMFQNVTIQQSSERSNMILFLTDGDPTDSEVSIYQAIEDGQASMNYSVQINTYALGTGLSSRSLRRLQRIAHNNSGVFLEIKDQNGDVLKRIMGSYYTSINSSLGKEPRISLPHMDPTLGVIVTMSLALIQNGSFTGVVAMDLPLERLFKEVIQLSSASLAYAALIDKRGRAILHPSLPDPSDVIRNRFFLPLSLFEPALPHNIILEITAGRSGRQRFEAGFPQPLGNHPTDGTMILKTNATYMWTPVGGSAYYIVCVVADQQSLTANLKSFRPPSAEVKSFYHRLDLSWNASISHPNDICKWKNRLISPASSTIKIAPDAFTDPDKYIYSIETLRDVQNIQQFFNDISSADEYKGLSEDVQADVMLTSSLEDIWQKAEFLTPNLVQWRFVGTQKGVLRMYPGLRFQKTYSHKQQPWYLQAVSSPDKLVASLRTSAYQPDTVVSLTKAVRKTSCQGITVGDKGETLAVMGMEMTKRAFLELIADNVGLKNDTDTDWYIMDNSGHIDFNFSSPNTWRAETKHLTEALPWLAAELIRRGVLMASWCNNYQGHTVEMFYEMTDFRDEFSNSSDPCRQFVVYSVPGTSLFLFGIPSRSKHVCTDYSSVTPQEGCSCGPSCHVCSDDVTSTCQCPCTCHMPYDKCHNSVTKLWTSTPCPVPAPPLFDTEKDQAVHQDALAAVPRCDNDCLLFWNITECQKRRGCHWCTYKANPSCSSECRTGQSLPMKVLFPCSDFLGLSPAQQVRVKLLFEKKLKELVPTLTTLSLEIVKFEKEEILFKVHTTTASGDLDSINRNIQHVVNQGKVALGPAADLPKVYIAKSSKQFTDLEVVLTLDSTLPPASQPTRQVIESELQSVLDKLLGKSLVSKIRYFSVNKTSVHFALNNEGQADLYPLTPFKERLEKAVTLRQISFKDPTGSGEAPKKKIIAVNISAISTFDLLCHPNTATPATETTTILTSQANKKSSQLSTPYVDSTLATIPGTGKSIPNSPSEMDKELNEGLTPVETAVVVTASVVGASFLPCLLYLLLSRRRPRTRKRRISPEGDTEEEWPSEISDLSDIDPDLNVIVNRAYVLHGESRTHRSPRENWARAKELTMPKHVPQGAWF